MAIAGGFLSKRSWPGRSGRPTTYPHIIPDRQALIYLDEAMSLSRDGMTVVWSFELDTLVLVVDARVLLDMVKVPLCRPLSQGNGVDQPLMHRKNGEER